MSTLTQTLPEKIWSGSGTACLISGYVASDETIIDVSVIAEDISSSTLVGLANSEIDQCCEHPNPKSCLMSGFTTLVKFPCAKENSTPGIEIRAEFKSGETKNIENCSIERLAENPISKVALSDSKVVICMACWEADEKQFKRQIDSIKSQTIKDWHCIINDDASSEESWDRCQDIIAGDSRFSLFRNDENLGFYRNFETALSRVPDNTEFVALADQDDKWYPDKLADSIAEFNSNTTLVYCDMRIVDEQGELLAESYWSGRRNNYQDADVLFLANTVTGAASVFRQDLLADILPFPQPVGQVFHDHWIACVARCKGSLAYVDRALYDYYQYGNSVIGQCDFEARGVTKRVVDVAANVKHLGKVGKLKSWLIHKRFSALNVFHHEYLRLYLFAEILKIRLPNMSTDAEQGLRMFSASWSAVFYLLKAHLRIIFKKETTDDAEMRLAAAVMMFKIDRIYGHLFAGRIMARHCPSLKRVK